ncbi:transmembrane protein 176A-like isoform X2 [Melanotaenia boesemani]|uniref:transmembrane protein 176A-like isoform X2 n=1 Tax=Melanotaenia boesemani TaxID=1250792 RepID=UPI001C04A86D|nr:transmembrane protein 176A-like isoform X2 [Melanotaenia boesemani]
MSVTVTKGDGITVLTMRSDPESLWPPVCQIIKNLCYSPVCCSVSQHLRTVQKKDLPVLGAMQVVMGLLNIGLGAILSINYWWGVMRTGFPYWLGGLSIAFGTMCILSQRFPSPCLVILSVTVNLAGVAFAITGIVLYSILFSESFRDNFSWDCRNNRYYGYTTPSPSPGEQLIYEKCIEGMALLQTILKGTIILLIVLSVLELCVAFSSFMLGVKALRRKKDGVL